MRSTLLLVVVVGLVTSGLIVEQKMSRRRHAYRGEIRTLYEHLQPGLTREAVREELASGRYPHLKFFDTNHDVWSVSTPAEFGASNWVLWIEFEAGRLSSLRVRTADSTDDHPPAAPPDKRTTRGSAACDRRTADTRVKKSKLPIVVTDVQPGFVDTRMAKADRLFWVASPQTAARQIAAAIRGRKQHAYVTRGWRLVAWLMRIVPDALCSRL